MYSNHPGKEVGSLDKVRNLSQVPLTGSHIPSVNKKCHTGRASCHLRDLGATPYLLALLLIQDMSEYQGNSLPRYT